MKVRVFTVTLTLLSAGLSVAWWHERRQHALAVEQATRLSRQNAELNFTLKQALKAKQDYEQRAVALDSQLGSAKARTTATESKQVQLTRELVETKNQLTEREQREVALMTELATLRQKVAAATSPGEEAVVLPTLILTPSLPTQSGQPQKKSEPISPALVASPAAPPPTTAEIAAYHQRIGELEQQLTQLLTRALADEPAARASSPPSAVPAAERIGHQVVRVGPRDSFVVIDVGAEQGARVGAKVSLLRRGELLAFATISEARPKFALAQVHPTTLKGQLQTGDLAVFTQ